MRYDYGCDNCKVSKEENHPMAESPLVICPKCGGAMRILILGVPDIYIGWNAFGKRSLLHRDRPTNEEYAAFKRYEASEDPKDKLRWMEAKGEI